jgi:hypothetical protein
MLSRLSSFLRYTLINEPTGRVTVAQEVETLKLYLDIELMRFEERLRTEFRIDEDARNALMPSLLLQPLVENAIKYAVSPLEDGAQITIGAQVVGSMLRVTVSDSGPGLPAGTDPSTLFGVNPDSTDSARSHPPSGGSGFYRGRPSQYPRPAGPGLWQQPAFRGGHRPEGGLPSPSNFLTNPVRKPRRLPRRGASNGPEKFGPVRELLGLAVIDTRGQNNRNRADAPGKGSK